MRSIEVPFIEGLEGLSPSSLMSVMEDKAAAGLIDSVNWPERFPYCPDCSFRLARGGESLAVLFSVSGKDLRATEMEDNGCSWEDSCCEMFISSADGGYFNFEFTCIGSLRLGLGLDRTDRELLPTEAVMRFCSLERKRYELADGDYSWSVGAVIPFSLLGLDPDNLPESLGCNFYKCGDLTAHPHYVTWNPVGTPKPDFHRPEFFGRLVFGAR